MHKMCVCVLCVRACVCVRARALANFFLTFLTSINIRELHGNCSEIGRSEYRAFSQVLVVIVSQFSQNFSRTNFSYNSPVSNFMKISRVVLQFFLND